MTEKENPAKKIVRILSMLKSLQTEPLTIEDISKKYNVSGRTIYRYMEIFKFCGFDVQPDEKFRYSARFTVENIFSESEKWVKIYGHEDFEVSSLGRVRDVQTHEYLSPVPFRFQGKVSGFQIELDGEFLELKMIVGSHFVPNPGSCQFIAFIDNDFLNCTSENLQWTNDPQIDITSWQQIVVQRFESGEKISDIAYELKIQENKVIELIKTLGLIRIRPHQTRIKIAELIESGLSYTEIASQLGISISSVGYQKGNLKKIKSGKALSSKKIDAVLKNENWVIDSEDIYLEMLDRVESYLEKRADFDKTKLERALNLIHEYEERNPVSS